MSGLEGPRFSYGILGCAKQGPPTETTQEFCSLSRTSFRVLFFWPCLFGDDHAELRSRAMDREGQKFWFWFFSSVLGGCCWQRRAVAGWLPGRSPISVKSTGCDKFLFGSTPFGLGLSFAMLGCQNL